jgi:DNA adenine methylase
MIRTQPLKWHGGKSYLARWIRSLAPPSVIDDPAHGYTHRNIVCAGGLGEFWNWLPIEGISEAVNDANDELINFYAVLRDPVRYASFRRLANCTPFSNDAFADAFDDALVNESDRLAAAFFTRYRQSRQGLGKDYATPTTRVRRGMNENVSAWLSAVDGLPECHERLRRVEIRNMDAIDFIRTYDHPRALFYLDPPYLHETRTSVGEYGEHEMTPMQHANLLMQLGSIKGKFMLSGYHSEQYDGFAESLGWRCHEREIDNKASSAKQKRKQIECVWTNY